jgi:ribosomal protein S18 acetylase RimI-like enzyme
VVPDPLLGVALLEHGLAASWARQCRWVPGSSVHHVGGLQVSLSGVADQTQQVAVVDGPVPEPLAATIAAEVLFDRAGWRPAFDLVAGVHPELEAALVERGFEVVVTRPGMVCDLRTAMPVPARDSTRPVSVEVATRRDRAGIVIVQQDAFDLSIDTAFGMVPEAMFADPTAAVLVARSLGGEVVGSVTVHFDGQIGAVVGLAVAGPHRRLGIGSTLTAAGLDVARSRGVEQMWLQSTPDGAGLYTALGFVVVGSCEVWLR